MKKLRRILSGPERRRSTTSMLVWINAIASSAVLPFVINIEHRLTALETEARFLLKYYEQAVTPGAANEVKR